MVSERELEGIRREARRRVEEAGLDPWPVDFAVVGHDQLTELAAYEGFPERYPHWRFGMNYDHYRKLAGYSDWWTYELVLNTNPALAFLRKSNSRAANKGIMIHVYAHVDFFQHNKWYKWRDNMAKVLRNHGQRIEEYMNRYGVSQVESFIDKVLSIQYNIDQHALFMKRRGQKEEGEGEEEELVKIPVKRRYMERFINPPQWIAEQKEELKRRRERRKLLQEAELEEPQKDLLRFLMSYGQLEEWQADILAMIREESYYFAPQLMTKIMNEGWGAYWQSRIMAQGGFAGPAEIIDHADLQSRVLGGKALNPYSLGKMIWEDIKERWDKGRFGPEWEECTDREERRRWDTKASLGDEKIFEVRRNYNDVTFLDEFFTEELFEELDLFTYEYIPETGFYHITSRDFAEVKKKLLFQHTNLGRPLVLVETGNYGNKGELLLVHKFTGAALHLDDARRALKNVYELWGRPVNLKTIVKRRAREPELKRSRPYPSRPLTAPLEEKGLMLRYDGVRWQELELPPDEVEDIRLKEDYNTVPQEWIG
ncbi:MAG: SpoVR family protein [Candidatus Bipolaricaulia bacterium]